MYSDWWYHEVKGKFIQGGHNPQWRLRELWTIAKMLGKLKEVWIIVGKMKPPGKCKIYDIITS